MIDDSLMLGFTAPLRVADGGLLMVEEQTVSGLRAWREHFGHVSAYAISAEGASPQGWAAVDPKALADEGIEIVPLPNTYDRKINREHGSEVSARLLGLMQKTRYHTFGYGGWIGDPGEIAAATARRHGIAHAVWFDRVESQVIRSTADSSLTGRAKSAIKAAIVERNERRAVRGADLSLLHGATVFNHFKNIARNPHLVEDVHFTDADRLTPDLLDAKITATAQGPLRILYVGRAAPMKGPFDWLKILAGLKANGVDFTARWVGDGELLDEMRNFASQNGLSGDDLHLEGFVSDRDTVRQFYRDAHVQLFCHLTDESPRNLIESLHSATPLVGYSDPFASGLVGEKDGGLLVQRGSTTDLIEALSGLARDRSKLADLIARAGASAAHLTRDNVFRHRSEIIRSQMPPARKTA
ncbi:glycosyltransferase [Paracoccus tegillarcae]|uniref:Glycosyl transferase family 1 n=1 Tax=Paracoccus tegillarcae TaxID=1529068 RepID=A0A2K9EZT5_9RHOB|nr:glycosyltransferase [Paracoccus tegillarcae]AUH34824.1 glycosyl transferase family 1 [Paracoccus tegillarcae]